MTKAFMTVAIAIVAGFVLLLCMSSVYAIPTHLGKTNMKRGCGGCHKGHGRSGTALLEKQKDEICFDCHGPAGSEVDVHSVITKISAHPVLETARYHVPGEDLPERDPSAQRHVSCFDCHNIHRSEKDNPVNGVRGYRGRGFARVKKVDREYQLCYQCHSDSYNLPGDSRNVAEDFDQKNASFHPIEGIGVNRNVPSLERGYSTSSLIKCSDCHGNDDPTGAAGPHGSIFEPILKYRYVRESGSESPDRYALCYQCHKRISILNDESFKAHKVHVTYGQISCNQCHDSHGSKTEPYLINFDEKVVYPNSLGELMIMAGRAASGKPRCMLTCHVNNQDYEHLINNRLQYCINGNCIEFW